MTDFRLLAPRRFLPRRGPLRPGPLDSLHLCRYPRHREGPAAQGAAQVLGGGLLLHEEGRYLRIGNRTFYEDPDQEVDPSGLVVVAVDAWARELARNTL